MPRVQINDAVVDFPDSLSPDELNSAVSSAAQQMSPPQSMGQKAWNALAWPEKKSREGLQMLAGMVPKPEPTGNLPMDLLKGAPRIAADTMAEAAPGFVSRNAILGSAAGEALGAGAPAIKGVLRSIGRQGEEMSGIAPKAEGALEAAYKDPTLIFAKGKKAAGGFYEAAKDDLNAAKDTYRATSQAGDGVVNMEKTKDIFSGKYQPHDILDTANKFIEGGGKMEPAEALKVRKAIDIMLKSKQNVPDELYKMRDIYDGIAKSSDNLAAGDAAYQRGIQADALRNVFPQNKYGGASAFKSAVAAAVAKIPGGQLLAAPMFSPMTQGALATGAGVATRALSPFVASGQNMAMIQAITEALNRRRQNAQ